MSKISKFTRNKSRLEVARAREEEMGVTTDRYRDPLGVMKML